jgi:site-specific recombinase XerD
VAAGVGDDARWATGHRPLDVAAAAEGFERSCLAKGLRSKTVSWYREMLAPFVRQFPGGLPTAPEDIEDHLARLGAVSDETRHDHYVALRVFYKWAAARLGAEDAMLLVARPRRRRKVKGALDESQLQRVMAAALSRRDRALLTLLVDTGMRIGEAASLTWGRVGPEAVTVDGKTGEREVPITDWTRWALLGCELPWEGRAGPLDAMGLARIVRRCFRRAGISQGGAHVLRHTFARMYLRSGGDVFTLQRIMGHASLSTTRVYLELELGDVVAAHARYSPIVRLLDRAAGANVT